MWPRCGEHEAEFSRLASIPIWGNQPDTHSNVKLQPQLTSTEEVTSWPRKRTLNNSRKTPGHLKVLSIELKEHKGFNYPATSAQTQGLFMPRVSVFLHARVPLANFLSVEASQPYIIRSQHYLQHSAPCSCIKSESSAIIQKWKLYRRGLFQPPSPPQSIVFHFKHIWLRYYSSHPNAPFPASSLFCLSVTSLLPFLPPILLSGSFSYLPFPSVVKVSLPITTTLPLFAPSVFCPQGVLSQSEANLPNYKPHLRLLSSSRSLALPRSSPQFYRYTEAKAGKTPFLSEHIRYTTFSSLSVTP